MFPLRLINLNTFGFEKRINGIPVMSGSFHTEDTRGEMLLGRKFVAYKDTMKNWEPPHENEELCEEHIESIIQEVQKSMNENTVQIMFE